MVISSDRQYYPSRQFFDWFRSPVTADTVMSVVTSVQTAGHFS